MCSRRPPPLPPAPCSQSTIRDQLRPGERRHPLTDAVEKCGFLLGAVVFRLSCAGGCYSNPRCVDFDANWADPIVSDFTHTMRTVGVLAAQGFGAQAF